MNPFITLTDIDVNRCRTDKGGFTRGTVEALGLDWPPVKGWVKNLHGVRLNRKAYQMALDARHNKEKHRGQEVFNFT